MSDSELIDWEQLSMIFGEDDEEFDEDMAELFQEFIEDGNARFDAIKDASFPEQKEFIAKESHKLKGSASNFGFTQVANLLAHIEDDIGTIASDDVSESLEKAMAYFKQSIDAVVSKYPPLASISR
ncbi:Hpt domain-containing protein [Pelagicoccus sp. SDUM812003]|uniref:Hpt domain-containing protein n=1 Tax=Pelagicoccus sp. SDUM812003 TaxID=3041267 RepID=UPI00280F27C7|nr:Hpt domain-containing protein [Pelagicoccus sp. SDUM812003]MDQ8202441.1 Hpt domain-containing protein [Pelagicoccus sp. SDUM812003]